jgi:hypothetical protein
VSLGTNGNCLGQMFPTPGVHTVSVDYVPDPYGIPSDRDIYAPSSGSTDFTDREYTVPTPRCLQGAPLQRRTRQAP